MHLGPFGCVMKLGAKWSDLVQKFVPRSRSGIFCKEGTRSTPLDPKPMFWRVSYYLGVFGTVWLPHETRWKMAELVQKFVPRSRVRIFRNERTRSTPLDPKLMFWGVSYYLCAFGAVWLHFKTLCKTDRTSAKVRAMKSRQNFFATNAPDPPH